MPRLSWRWLIVLLIVLAGTWQALKLQINDEALDLLPGDAVRGDIALLQRLGLVDRLFITLTVDPALHPGEDEALAALKSGADKIGRAMTAAPLFTEVIYRFPTDFELALFQEIEPHLPALLSEADLAGLESGLDEKSLTISLQERFALLNSPAGFMLKNQVQRDPLGLLPLVLRKLSHLESGFTGSIDDGFFVSADRRSVMVLAESTRSLTDSTGAREVGKLLATIMTANLPAGVQWRVIGSLPHTLANADSIQHDLRLLLPIATLLLFTLLILTLKDWRAFLVLGIPFLAAPAAIAVMGLIHGRVSALALGFGIVLIGIAVDFSVHIYLALVSNDGRGADLKRRLLRPVALATLTTAGVFVILLLSEVPSHRQMATLSLTGILLAVTFSWLLLPTIVRPRGVRPASWFKVPVISSLPWRIAALLLWGCLLIAGFLSWPQLRYNGDLKVLDAPDAKVIADEEHFRATWRQGGDQAFVVAAGETLEAALDQNFIVYDRLLRTNSLRFQSLAPLLPGPAAQKRQLLAWNDFWQAREETFPQSFNNAAQTAGFNPTAFQPFLKRLASPPTAMDADNILHGPLQTLLATMVRLPEQQRSAADANRDILLLTTVEPAAEALPMLLALEQEYPAITVLANQKWRQQVEELMRHDMVTLVSGAALLIILLTLITFRRPRLALAVLAPVISALAAMILFSRLSSGELNMMHLLMGIMVIGLSVDYGIFVVCARGERLAGETFLAVSICAASSLLSFGVLAFAHHPALHSLGITVLCGIGMAWPTALLISPILAGNGSKNDNREIL